MMNCSGTHKGGQGECIACAQWRKEVAPFVRPRETLERFKARWRAHALARVGCKAHLAMPALLTDAQFRARCRSQAVKHVVTAFDPKHTTSWHVCRCLDCQRTAWEHAVTTYQTTISAAA